MTTYSSGSPYTICHYHVSTPFLMKILVTSIRNTYCLKELYTAIYIIFVVLIAENFYHVNFNAQVHVL